KIREHDVALEQRRDDRHSGRRVSADIRPDHRLPGQGAAERRGLRPCGPTDAEYHANEGCRPQKPATCQSPCHLRSPPSRNTRTRVISRFLPTVARKVARKVDCGNRSKRLRRGAPTEAYLISPGQAVRL